MPIASAYSLSIKSMLRLFIISALLTALVVGDACKSPVGHPLRRSPTVPPQKVPDGDVPVPPFADHLPRPPGSFVPAPATPSSTSFASFRLNYLIVHAAIMLADGLQGTHLYVLYESYNFDVAALYAAGFAAGALASPITGPLVDRIGRRGAAVLYCLLEIGINLLEQSGKLWGAVTARMVGGVTMNLLYTVFESWLVTEHRRRGFHRDGLEVILRDSVIVTSLSSIASGYLAHRLAHYFGAVGPFRGAVFFTLGALVLVMCRWTENYGSESDRGKTVRAYMTEAYLTIVGDRSIVTIGVAQGLSEGCLFVLVYLWSPVLTTYSERIPKSVAMNTLGLDEHFLPAYGLIFGGFMACGALGGYMEPSLRRILCKLLGETTTNDVDNAPDALPVVELLASLCYLVGAALLSVPALVSASPHAFSLSLAALFLYQFTIGVYMPCEGLVRSFYLPKDSVCSVMTMLRVVVNTAVAAGVYATTYLESGTVFGILSAGMVVAAVLQLTLVGRADWVVIGKRLVGAGASKEMPMEKKIE